MAASAKPNIFLRRPILSSVISIVITLVGALAMKALPIAQYPELVPPTVNVTAFYPGASAETIASTVLAPLEVNINGVENMLYMTSTASSGSGQGSINVYFSLGTDPDMALVNVNNKVNLTQSTLPETVRLQGVTVVKRSPAMLQVIALYSPDGRYDAVYLHNYMQVNVADELKRVPGVGDVTVFGYMDYSMRIWLVPDKLAKYGVTVSEVSAAIQEQNSQFSPGRLGDAPMPDTAQLSWQIDTKGRLNTPEEFGEIIIRTGEDSAMLRLKDVARIEMGGKDYSVSSEYNGMVTRAMGIYLLPGANAIATGDAVTARLKELARNFPEGVAYKVIVDTNEFVMESINEVVHTLVEAMILVFIVVFVFLQSWRATLIPCIAVPVSIIGTFAGMYALGYTINTLTLFGMVLAIGIVVDDAIVVVENVERIMAEERVTAREATHKAMRELSGALIATSMVLAAVFVPVSFLGGITGQLYRQFSVTIVVSVLLSTVVALTLSPAMCAIILRPSHKKKAFIFRKINLWLAKGNKKYTKLLRISIANPRRILAGFGMVLVAIFVLNRVLPTSFIPEEDQGFFTVELEMPEGTTLERTRAVTDRAIEFLDHHPAVAYVQNVTGSSPRVGTNQGRATLTVILKPWEERKSSGMKVEDVMADARREFYYYPEAKSYVNRPPVIPGLGESGGLEMQLEARGDASWDNLVSATDTFLYYASQAPELQGVSSAMQSEIPQLYFDVDRDRAKFLGIPLSDIFSTMKAYLGSVYVNDFNMFNRIYRVYIQAEAPYRATRDNLDLFFVRSKDGAMVPLTALGTTQYTTGPGTIKRSTL